MIYGYGSNDYDADEYNASCDGCKVVRKHSSGNLTLRNGGGNLKIGKYLGEGPGAEFVETGDYNDILMEEARLRANE